LSPLASTSFEYAQTELQTIHEIKVEAERRVEAWLGGALDRDRLGHINKNSARGAKERELADLLGSMDGLASRAGGQVETELELPATLLVGNQPALFGEVDRLRAEGDLRAAVVLPGLALAVLGIVQSSGWWAFAIPLLGLLLVQAFQRERESRQLIANAMSQGVIESQSVARFRNLVASVDQRLQAEASSS
jgi:hypothetical protein